MYSCIFNIIKTSFGWRRPGLLLSQIICEWAYLHSFHGDICPALNANVSFPMTPSRHIYIFIQHLILVLHIWFYYAKFSLDHDTERCLLACKLKWAEQFAAGSEGSFVLLHLLSSGTLSFAFHCSVHVNQQRHKGKTVQVREQRLLSQSSRSQASELSLSIEQLD